MFQPKDVPEPWLSFLSELDEIAATEVRLDCINTERDRSDVRYLARATPFDSNPLQLDTGFNPGGGYDAAGSSRASTQSGPYGGVLRFSSAP
jgi:hypothetical protein